MFNISFGEVVVVAVIGLIVIGPKRLPEAARFVGHLLSRVQRQVADVKSDIRREMDLEDLKSIQREYESAARDIKDDFSAHTREVKDAVADGKAAMTAQWPGASESPNAANTEKRADNFDSDSDSNSDSDSATATTSAAHGTPEKTPESTPEKTPEKIPPR